MRTFASILIWILAGHAGLARAHWGNEMQICAELAQELQTETRLQALEAMVFGVKRSGLLPTDFTRTAEGPGYRVVLGGGGGWLNFAEIGDLPDLSNPNRTTVAGGLFLATIPYDANGRLADGLTHEFGRLRRGMQKLEARAERSRQLPSFDLLWSRGLVDELRERYLASEDPDLFKLLYLGEAALARLEKNPSYVGSIGPMQTQALHADPLVRQLAPHLVRNRMALVNAVLVRFRFATESGIGWLGGRKIPDFMAVSNARALAVYAAALTQIPEFVFFALVDPPKTSFARLAKALWPLILRLTRLAPTFDEPLYDGHPDETRINAQIEELGKLIAQIRDTIAESDYLATLTSDDGVPISSRQCLRDLSDR